MLLAFIITTLLFGLVNLRTAGFKTGRARLIQCAYSTLAILMSSAVLAYALA